MDAMKKSAEESTVPTKEKGQMDASQDAPPEETREAQRSEVALAHYRKQYRMKQFIPLPRDVLMMGLSSSVILLYGLLLDRATLSQRSGWWNRNGCVYVHFTTKNLSKEMRMSESSVRRMLLQLEKSHLIFRIHSAPGTPSYIFLRIPRNSVELAPSGENSVPNF